MRRAHQKYKIELDLQTNIQFEYIKNNTIMILAVFTLFNIIMGKFLSKKCVWFLQCVSVMRQRQLKESHFSEHPLKTLHNVSEMFSNVVWKVSQYKQIILKTVLQYFPKIVCLYCLVWRKLQKSFQKTFKCFYVEIKYKQVLTFSKII